MDVPDFPDEIFGKSQHLKSTRKLLTWIDSKNWDAAVVGGDFNTVFLARSIRLMTGTFDDVLWPSMNFFQGTNVSKTALPVRPRIDYIFHTEQLSVKSATVLSQHIGDHLPVVAELAFTARSFHSLETQSAQRNPFFHLPSAFSASRTSVASGRLTHEMQKICPSKTHNHKNRVTFTTACSPL